MAKQVSEKQVILIADDSEMNRAILAEMLGEDYEILEAENGAVAVDVIRARGRSIDLLLLDINMPELDGFQVLDMLNREHWIEDLPVIMISSESDSSFIERSYDLGACDYISRPFDVRVVRRRVVNTLMLYVKQKRLAQMVAEQVYEKERGNNLMISILSHIVEFRNGESGRHVINIRVITEILLRNLITKTDRYGLTRFDIPLICTASALHDVGKLTVPDEILNKPGRFTPEEFEIMKRHSAAGGDMLKSLTSFQDEPLVKSAYEICRWHHERWDGRGYPDGLKGDEIPISAQVVSVADVYDALTSERCYKKSFPHDVAIQMITGGECGSFNPLLIECLLDVAPALPGELLHAGNLDQTGEKQASEVLQELLYRNDMGVPSRVPWAVDADLEKKRFWEARAEEIRFDFNAASSTVTLSEWGAKKLGLRSTALSMDGGIPEQMNAADVQAVSALLHGTTPDSPEIDHELLLSIGGELRWCRVVARAMWHNDGEKLHYMGAVGKVIDIHERSIMESGGTNSFDSFDEHEVASAIRQLKRVFDEVRLVDVQQAAVIGQEDDEEACIDQKKCYAIWGKPHRCSRCISARALAQKARLTKFEVVDDEVYQVISRYMELDGRPCVMEMVAHIRDGDIDEVGSELIERMKGYSDELYLDSLTGVYNRRYYDEQIDQVNRFNAVAMIDVDDFKHINDTYGHYAGDQALQAITVAIDGCIRSSDVLLRYGGDEFLLLFPEIPDGSFREKLKLIQGAVREISLPEFPEISLTISVGGAYDVQPLLKAVQLADRRMYEAKTRNKAARDTAARG